MISQDSLRILLVATYLVASPIALHSKAQAPNSPNVAVAAAPPLPNAPVPKLGFIGSVGSFKKGCVQKFCESPLGRLLNNAKAPLNAFSGGMVPGPTEHAPAVGVEGGPPPPPAVQAAVKIKAEAAQAKARAEAVRYLGEVDCHWYPEAEAGLIAALRADRNECVRLEAALALRRGCCCTEKTIEALRIAATGSNSDGNPGERCMRVRVAAFEALQICLQSCAPKSLESGGTPATRPENPEPSLAADANYYNRVAAEPAEAVLLAARRSVVQLSPAQREAEAEAGPRSLRDIWLAAASRPESDVTLGEIMPVRMAAHLPSNAAQPRVLAPNFQPAGIGTELPAVTGQPAGSALMSRETTPFYPR